MIHLSQLLIMNALFGVLGLSGLSGFVVLVLVGVCPGGIKCLDKLIVLVLMF